MKTFLVGFDCGNGIFSCNMIWANTGANERQAVWETAERRASKFGCPVCFIRELSEGEVESNIQRGMPAYSIDEEAEAKYDPSFAAKYSV